MTGTEKLIDSTEKFFGKVAKRLDEHEIGEKLNETIQLAELAKACLQIVKLSKEDAPKGKKKESVESRPLSERMRLNGNEA